jgi:hypothetical protein
MSDQNKSGGQILSQEITDDFLQKYVPIELFVATKNIPEEKVLEMIREGTCVGYTKSGQWFVGRNELDDFKGDIALGNSQSKSNNAAETLSSNGLLRLFRGELGLVNTFWLLGVVVGMIFFFIVFAVLLIDEDLTMFFFSIWVIYQFMITIGVMRSSKYYKGEAIWAALAIIVSLGFSALMGFIWLLLFSVSISGYASN